MQIAACLNKENTTHDIVRESGAFGLSVLRQWAGLYDIGKNGKPVVGFTEVEGFVQMNGFGRMGMSIALAAGEELAKLIFGEKSLFGRSLKTEEIQRD